MNSIPLILADGEKSHNCLEGDRFPSADNYFNLQSIYNFGLEGAEMEERICLNCKKTFFAHPNQIKRGRGKYCSQKCRDLRVQKKCLFCGEEFLVSQYRIGKYCSPECHYQAHRQTKVCPICNHEFEINKSETKRGRKYCSRECSIQAEKGRIPSWCIGKSSWNKGLKGYNAGEKHPLFGKGHSDKSKKKMSESHKGHKFPKERRDKLKGRIPWNKGIPFLQIRGDKNPNWNGGSSFEPYCPKFNNELKEKIRERDNRSCGLCGCKENGEKLHVHHVHYDKPNCYPDLISLCRSCHMRTQSNRDYYEDFFMKLLKTRGLIC